MLRAPSHHPDHAQPFKASLEAFCLAGYAPLQRCRDIVTEAGIKPVCGTNIPF